METPESSKAIQWCKCIVCVEYFTSDDKIEHIHSYEHNKRVTAHSGKSFPDYVFDVRELPADCAPYYSGEMPTEAELCIEFHCATNNLHEFEMDTDYFTRKLDELGGDISDMKKLLDQLEPMNTVDTVKMNIQVLDETELNDMNSSNESIEQDYIEERLLELAIKESKDFYKPLDVETDELISKVEILDIEQEKIKNNYLESLLGEPTVKIQNVLTEDDLFDLSEDNIEFDDDFSFDSDSDN
ncbi:Hypothetical protein PACV_381 [Pacmanvirus A23]|uniref:Hypothetical protein n=1 Tax=Pacmanvirus A23 TaxID=1932881 RepID=UPI000A095585|nr:Hypothetical protein B9W72_gp377 [Pacmanvirus A23]SIP86094.1 Hypothetical protein PACV_381 [Pacmanvirus A23]